MDGLSMALEETEIRVRWTDPSLVDIQNYLGYLFQCPRRPLPRYRTQGSMFFKPAE